MSALMMVIASTLPFNEQLLLTIISGAIPLILLPITFWVMMRFMPQLIDMMRGLLKGLDKMERDYHCNCSRCRFELRTKKGVKQWKRYHKREHKFSKDDMI